MTNIATLFGGGGVVGVTGWRPPEDMPEEDWIKAGQWFGRVGRGLGWWIGDWWIFGQRKYGERKGIVDAEDWTGPDFQTCMNAGSICRAFETSRRREALSFKHHAEVAGISDKVEADRLLDKAEEERLSTSELRAEVAKLRQIHRVEKLALPSDRFPIILADPPWRYENAPMGGSNRAIENHYPTMALEDICALPISEIAGEDCNLYLWATAPKLEECFTVLAAWGFQYRTNIVWVKDKIGMGYHARSQHELLLIAKRGIIPAPLPEDRVSSVVYGDREEHSRKPAIFYEMIERWYPPLPKLELFCRMPRPGWHAWGNDPKLAEAAE